MSLCGRKALTLLSSVLAVSGLGLLGVAVSTDYWLYLEEGVILPLNQSADIRMSLHSGLWRVCFMAVEKPPVDQATVLGNSAAATTTRITTPRGVWGITI
ncbi:hypothetical protein AALO_G00082870 [Alosa alosa]|uniref:Uncharacterized protein n=1 Tax=Alosa alosa TaxID=278164 RepID=A0AAV6H2C9_9TELE|nr:hypothetical protein AALO_G00082870 [Alosa alosa]